MEDLRILVIFLELFILPIVWIYAIEMFFHLYSVS